MALQTKTLTANGAKGHHKFTLTVSENSTSVSGNTSSLSFSFVLSPIQTSWNWEQWNTSISYTISINGNNYTGYIPDYDGYNSVTLKSSSLSVGHNSDGSKSISVSFSVTDNANQYYTCGNASSSSSMTLTTIPRASSFGSISGNTIGSNMTVNINRNSSSFTHQLWYKLGNSSWYDLGTGIGTQKVFTISNELLSQLPSSTSGTLQLCLRTYSGSAQIGSDAYKNITVYVPSSVVPSVGTITLDPVNITTGDGTSRNILVQNKNRLTVSVSGCTAGAGSSIKSYTFSGPGISTTTTNTSATSGTISNTGTLSYNVTVTDNRGRTASKSATIKCYAYALPSFKSFSAYRCNSDGTANENGTYIKCSFNLTYSSVNGSNNVTVKAMHKKNTATSYSSTSIFTNSDVTAGSKILSSISLNSTYTVYATIVDNYGGSASSTTITIFGASRIINITSDGTGVAFGKMAESTKLLESRYRVKAPGLLSSRDGRNTTNINIASDNEHLGCLESFIVKSGNTGVPSLGDGHVAHFHWDNTGGYDSQLYLKNSTGEIMSRGCNGGTWGNWNAVEYKPTSLYSTSTGNVGTITLSQSAANFTYLEIFYTDNNTRQPNSIKVYSPNGKYVSLSCIEPSTSGSEPRVYIRTSGWTISGTTMTPGRTDLNGSNRGVYGQIYKDAGGTYVDVNVTAKNYIKIFRVLGYA